MLVTLCLGGRGLGSLPDTDGVLAPHSCLRGKEPDRGGSWTQCASPGQ